MVLIIGGYAAGKRAFAHGIGFSDDEIFELLDHKTQFEAVENCSAIILREMGCGLVPVDKDIREERESMGRLACKLAEVATEVYRVSCGIGTRIK